MWYTKYMEIKNTSSFIGEDGVKNFEIITKCGESFICEPSGQRWVCLGFKGTLKSIKANIESGYFDDPLLDDTEMEGLGGTSLCVHPCAHLVNLLTPEQLKLPQVVRTLYEYAWLTESGLPDTDRARREFKASQNE